MKKIRNKKLSTVFPPCLQFVGLMSVMVVVLSFVASRIFYVAEMKLGKVIFWNIEYFFVLALFMELYGLTEEVKGKKLLAVAGFYALSFSLIYISENYLILNFWMLGVALMGFVVPPYFAVTFHLILSISYCLIQGRNTESFLCYFTFGAFLLLLAPFLDKLRNAVLIAVITVTTNFAFLILQNDFKLVYTNEVIETLISTAFLVGILWMIQVFVISRRKQAEEELDLNPIVMNRLRAFSQNLYEHSMYIGQLSKEAAKVAGADETVAYAGGCYHEVGRMEGNDYIQSGEKFLKQYGVSEKVIAVVKEHNIHKGIPTSKEAAIVMLSDSIVSTMIYLKEKQPKIQVPLEEMVQSIFQRRLENGLLAQSGLEQKELGRLQQYYCETLKRTVSQV